MEDTKLNITELLRKRKNRKEKRLQIFSKVLQKCHMRIKSAAINEQIECDFYVPKLVVGYPLYDIGECEEYISECLQKNGFRITLKATDEGNLIRISWGHYE